MNWLTIVSIAFAVSLIANVFLTWYAIKMLRELVDVSSSIEEMFSDIDSFIQHLSGVYQLEMFYGDQTLENLLAHSAMLKEEIQKYKLSFSLIDDNEETDEDDRFSQQAST
mgnify:CR=1 FL=1|jgi:hypothetical protein